ncbi:MAG: hypothetical protein ACRECH_13090 [Nitrososphaerales archaeon]
MEFEEFVVEKNDEGIWRKCPYCGAKVWDGPHSQGASGFIVHLTQKISGHAEKQEWKTRYEKDSWQLGT